MGAAFHPSLLTVGAPGSTLKATEAFVVGQDRWPGQVSARKA
ncbi:hypothetical protein ACIPN8_12040 [Streptomyces sp. NPDC086082]